MWPFAHCPRCGSALPPPEGNVQHCRACAATSYLNPKPTACALVLDERGRVLLARRARPPYAGFWDIPGGYCDPGETAEACIVRELREETGLEVEVGRYVESFADVYAEPGEQGEDTFNLLFEARLTGGREAPADDVDELRWFALDELPPAHELPFCEVGPALRRWAASAARPSA